MTVSFVVVVVFPEVGQVRQVLGSRSPSLFSLLFPSPFSPLLTAIDSSYLSGAPEGAVLL